MPPRKLDAKSLRQPSLTIDRRGRRWVGTPVEVRLKARLLNMDVPGECWVWTGFTNESGYGLIGLPGSRIAFTHRVAYALHHNTDPGPLLVCHTCDNPPCCNPAHLFTGSQVDNMADMARKGRSRWRLIDDQQVRDIRARAASGERYADLAEAYGISRKYVGRVVRRACRTTADDGTRTACESPLLAEVGE